MAEDERPTFFDVWGPVEVGRRDGVVTSAQGPLWADFEEQMDGVSAAIGCYMFCFRTSKNIRPWYVGLTLAKGGFKAEAFQKHKLEIYNEVIGKRRGKPLLFLFPLMTPGGRLAKGGDSHKRVIQWLERYLMMTAFARNPDISNVRDMKYLRQVEVLGVLGKRKGRPHQQATDIRRVLFGTPERLDS